MFETKPLIKYTSTGSFVRINTHMYTVVLTALERVLEEHQELQIAGAEEQGDSAAADSTEAPAPNRAKCVSCTSIAECLANQTVRQLHSCAVSSFLASTSASAKAAANVNILTHVLSLDVNSVIIVFTCRVKTAAHNLSCTPFITLLSSLNRLCNLVTQASRLLILFFC